jgi:hypothetical protein
MKMRGRLESIEVDGKHINIVMDWSDYRRGMN